TDHDLATGRQRDADVDRPAADRAVLDVLLVVAGTGVDRGVEGLAAVGAVQADGFVAHVREGGRNRVSRSFRKRRPNSLARTRSPSRSIRPRPAARASTGSSVDGASPVRCEKSTSAKPSFSRSAFIEKSNGRS